MTVSTFTATSARSWRDESGGWRTENLAYQGDYGFGHHKGLWFFDDAAIRATLDGEEVTGIRLRLTRSDGGGVSSAQTPTIRHHNYSSQPSSEPSLSSANVTSQSWAWGETDWVTLTTGWGAPLRDGLIRGFAIYTTSNSPYMIFEANAVLEVTHEPAITAPATPDTPTIDSVSSTEFTLTTNTPSGTETWHWNPEDAGSDYATRDVPEYTRGGQPGNTYRVRVRACNAAGCSSYSSFRTILMLPAKPSGLEVSTDTQEASLTWNSQTLGTGGYYEIRRNGSVVATTTSTAWTDTSLASSTRYGYSIRAVNDAGASSYTSAVFGVTKAFAWPESALLDVSQAITQLQDGTTVYVVVDGSGDYDVRRALLDGSTVSLGTIGTDSTLSGNLKRLGVPQSIALTSDRDGNLFVVGHRGGSTSRVGFIGFQRTGPDSWTKNGLASAATVAAPQNFTAAWVREGSGAGNEGRLFVALSSGYDGTVAHLYLDAYEALRGQDLTVHESETNPLWAVASSSYGTMEGAGLAVATDSLGSTSLAGIAMVTNRVTGGGTDGTRLSTFSLGTSGVFNEAPDWVSPLWDRPSATVVGYGAGNFVAAWGSDVTNEVAVREVGGSTSRIIQDAENSLAAADYSPDDEAVFVYTFHPSDGLVRTPLFTETGALGTREVVDATVPIGPRDLRVPAVVDGRYIEVQYASGSTTFVRVQTSHNQPPDAPDLDPVSSFDASDAKDITWTFRDPNPGDSQSAYELTVENVETGDEVLTTGETTSTSEGHTLPAGTLTNGESYRVRVRTWDSEGEVSPWSAWKFFSPSAAATVELTEPPADANLIVSDVLVEWTYSHPASEAQTEYRVRLLESGTSTEVQSTGWIASDATSHSLTGLVTGNYDLELQVRTSGVPSNVDVHSITVDVSTPDEPLITVDVREGFIRVSADNPSPTGDRPNVETNYVYRRRAGETAWVRLANDVENSGTYDDYSAGSGTEYEYKVRAIGVGGGFRDSIITSATLHLEGVWLHNPTDPSGTARHYRYKAGSRKETFGAEVELLHFAGREFPVADWGEFGEQTLALDIFIPYEQEESNQGYLRDVVSDRQTIAYRDNRGRVIFAVLRDLSLEDVAGGTEASFSVTRVFFQEEV